MDSSGDDLSSYRPICREPDFSQKPFETFVLAHRIPALIDNKRPKAKVARLVQQAKRFLFVPKPSIEAGKTVGLSVWVRLCPQLFHFFQPITWLASLLESPSNRCVTTDRFFHLLSAKNRRLLKGINRFQNLAAGFIRF